MIVLYYNPVFFILEDYFVVLAADSGTALLCKCSEVDRVTQEPSYSFLTPEFCAGRYVFFSDPLIIMRRLSVSLRSTSPYTVGSHLSPKAAIFNIYYIIA